MYNASVACAAIALFLGRAVAGVAGEGDCAYRSVEPWLAAEKDGEVYVIMVKDEGYVRQQLNWGDSRDIAAARAGQIPPGRVSAIPLGEFLAGESSSTALYIGRNETSRPIPLDAVWRGSDPLSCFRSFAQAAGLEVRAPQPGFWLVGPPGALETAALVAYAYPIDPEGRGQRSQQDAAVVERALLARLPIRMVEGTPGWIGVGYYWIPEEPDTLLVVTTHGHRAPRYKLTLGGEIDEQVFKVKLQRGEGKVKIECVWGAGATGPLLLGIAEDFDGDGYRDFVFESPEVNTVPTVILSGATGAPLARLSTLRLAIQKDANGPKKLLADGGWQDYESQAPQVFTYSENAKAFEPEQGTPTASAQGTGQSRKPLSWAETRFVAPLAAQVGGFEHLRVYYFPDGAAEAMPKGTEEVKLRWPTAWHGWVLNDDPQETFEKRQKDFPVHILLSYFSAGYLKELDAKRQAHVQQ